MGAYPFLGVNLEILQRENPSIHHWLMGQARNLNAPAEELIQNRKGYLDWRLPTGKGLFDALTPWDAYRDWRIPDQAETSVTLVVGCNLGYGLNHILPKLPGSHQVLVLEPRPEMLSACLGHTDYRPFLETKRLLFIPPVLEYLRQTVSRMILPCLFGKIILRSDLPSLQLSGEYAAWTERCREALEDLRVGVYTIRMKQDEMIRNELHNFQRARVEGSLLGLQNQMEGGTAVILGAGPSLEKFASALAERPGNAVYATSLQALPALRRWGLKPHFCMATDSGKLLLKAYRGLDREWAREIPLIYSTTVNPEVVTRYPGPTLPLWTQGGLASHALEGKELVLDVGSSVGVGLVRFMRWCGAARVLLVGHDFSWPGDRTHAQDHPCADQAFQFDSRAHVRLKNRFGETVFSAPPYLTALRELERDLDANPMPVFDLCGGGLGIRGSEPVRWRDLLERRLLNSDPVGFVRFMEVLKGGLRPRGWELPRPRANRWNFFLDSTRRHLEGLFRKSPADQKQVRTILDRVLAYLQEETLPRAYLLNDMLSLAGLIYTARSFGAGELLRCGEILERVKGKIQDMEWYLVPEGKAPPIGSFQGLGQSESASMTVSTD